MPLLLLQTIVFMMKSARFIGLYAILLAVSLSARSQQLTLDDVVGNSYTAYGYGAITPLPDGESYARVEGGTRVVKYSFQTAEPTETLFDVSQSGGKIKSIDGFVLSPTGDYMLLQTETEQIYRHSKKANYYIYRLGNSVVEPLSEGGKQQEPLFSPDGTMVAFVRDNNLFLVKLMFQNSESQVTRDGERNKIINGLPDWVYEEEFSFSRAFDFSADSKMLAWLHTDESQIPEWHLQYFKDAGEVRTPENDYPTDYAYKYPLAGTPNSKVSVQTYDIKAHVTRTIDLPLDDDGYIPRLRFTPEADRLCVLTLNRLQNTLRFYIANARSGICTQIIEEKDDYYVKEDAYTQFCFEGTDRLLLISDRSGTRQLYLYSLTGQLQSQLTNIPLGITTYLGCDPKTKTYFVRAQDGSPMRTAIYSVKQGSEPKVISPEQGTNRATFSGNGQYFINTHSTINSPYTVTLCKSTGKVIKTLVDNAELKARLTQANLPQKEFFTFTLPTGEELNGWICKPADFNPAQQYPVVLFQYSGPGSQEVIDSWDAGGSGALLEAYWAQLGILTACVDGRGTGGRGAYWEKCTYQNLGNLESKDQVEAALYLGKQSYIDASRIAIWGWSFGGFNTLMSMSEGRPVFKCGVAVAPVTNFGFYDTVYSERYMRTPQQNPDGYGDNPLSRADRLSGRLLLIHGLTDDNVHYRNSAEYADALVKADKQFEMQVYTNRNHFIWGGNTRHHLFTRITEFLQENL